METFSTGRPSGGAEPETGGEARRLPRGALALFSAVCLLVILDHASNAGEVRRGVGLGPVELGGKTLAGARRSLENEATVLLRDVKLVGPEGVSFTAGEIGVGLDVAATAEKSYAVGREGGVPARLGVLVGGAQVSSEVRHDRQDVQAKLASVAAPLLEETREAGVRVTGSEVEVLEAREGRAVDVAATVENVVGAVREGRGEAEIAVRGAEPEVTTREAREAGAALRAALSGPARFTAGEDEWVLSPAELGGALEVSPEGRELRVSFDRARLRASLGEAYAALVAEPVQTRFVVEGGEVSVREGRAGRRIDEGRLVAELEDGLLDGEGGVRRFELPVVTSRPEMTAEEAPDAGPTDLIGRYRTNYMTYDDGPGRVANLEISSRAVDETVLAPGEVFSFNELAEPLDYYATSVIVDGQVDTADGGGLCQVASTLYMAANHAGLKVLERHPHYAELPYIRPGFDATVWFGDLDMRFENTTDGYLLLREWVDEEGYVNAEIWGRPSGKKVQMDSQLVSTSLDYEGNPVTEWVTYKKVERNGKVVSDGPIHRDTYGYLKP